MSNTPCCIPTCWKSSRSKHAFPNPAKDSQLFDKWVNLCGNQQLLSEYTPQKVYISSRVCSLHFLPTDFGLNNKLKKGVLPSLNLPGGKLIMPSLQCCIPTCWKSPEMKHLFPNPAKHNKFFFKWVLLAGNKNLLGQPPEMIYRNNRVCSLHFTKGDFGPNRKLKSGVFPSLNLPELKRNCFKKWVQQVGNPILQEKTAEQIYKSYVVCRRHFSEEDLLTGFKRGLRRTAFPTLYLPSDPLPENSAESFVNIKTDPKTGSVKDVAPRLAVAPGPSGLQDPPTLIKLKNVNWLRSSESLSESSTLEEPLPDNSAKSLANPKAEPRTESGKEVIPRLTVAPGPCDFPNQPTLIKVKNVHWLRGTKTPSETLFPPENENSSNTHSNRKRKIQTHDQMEDVSLSKTSVGDSNSINTGNLKRKKSTTPENFERNFNIIVEGDNEIVIKEEFSYDEDDNGFNTSNSNTNCIRKKEILKELSDIQMLVSDQDMSHLSDNTFHQILSYLHAVKDLL